MQQPLTSKITDLLKTATESIDEAFKYTEFLAPIEYTDIDTALNIAQEAIAEAQKIVEKYKAEKNQKLLNLD